MKPIALILALSAIAVAGCSSTPGRSSHTRTPPTFNNTEAYDRYVVRRADELAASGTYTRQQAAAIAENEATRRYGTRTKGGSTETYSWSTSWGGKKSEPLTLSELDKTTSDLKKSRK